VHKLLTPKIIFFRIYKKKFSGFGVGQIIALPPKFDSLAVNNKVIYQCKRGFFCGICIEKRARSFVDK